MPVSVLDSALGVVNALAIVASLANHVWIGITQSTIRITIDRIWFLRSIVIELR